MDNEQTLNIENQKNNKTKDLKTYQKEYRDKNKEKIKNYYNEWIKKPENNPLKKIKCPECNSFVVKSSISKHMKTTKCKSYKTLNDLESIKI
jgi:hypothetical protein